MSSKFFKAVMLVEVLSEGAPVSELDMADIVREIQVGDCVGKTTCQAVKQLSSGDMAQALIEFGSEPGFFSIDVFGTDVAGTGATQAAARSVFAELKATTTVQTGNSAGAVPFVVRDDLIAAAMDDEIAEPSANALQYPTTRVNGDGTHLGFITIGELSEAIPLGENGWLLPNGSEMWFSTAGANDKEMSNAPQAV